LRAARRKAGKPINAMDALIAAIAVANAMTLATRNISDFQGLGLPLVNPFDVP
jgi:predicted nucleic acid-binding protein